MITLLYLKIRFFASYTSDLHTLFGSHKYISQSMLIFQKYDSVN